MALLSARVKNVLSADTVVLVPPRTTAVPAPERILTLSHVQPVPTFEAKEFVRHLLIGKEVRFSVSYKHPNGKEFGDILTPICDSLTEYLVEKGVVEVKDHGEESDFVDGLRQLAIGAKSGANGPNSRASGAELVPLDDKIIANSVTRPIDTVVERVISGDRLMVRLLVSKRQHVATAVLLAGYKSPRTDAAEGAGPDSAQSQVDAAVASRAKQYVEDKLLIRDHVKVKIIGESQTGVPIVVVEHPSGNNLHEKMVENGYGTVVDWQSTMVGSGEMGKLRRAEAVAREMGRGVHSTGAGASAGASGPNSSTSGPSASTTAGAGARVTTKTLRPGLTFSGTITRILQADTLVIRLPGSSDAVEEVTVQLASVRAPKPSDTTVTSNKAYAQALANTAREFVRAQAIGKTATVYVDGFRPPNADLGLAGRFLISATISGTDLSELVVQNGWAGVIKHSRATSAERALNWDRLVDLEARASQAGKGIHAKDVAKVLTVGTRTVDASENNARARSFLSQFRKRTTGYHVDFVPALNRLKLYNPKEGMKLTLVLGGLANEKTPFGDQAVTWMNGKILQRNVEFEVWDVDKMGGFIGNLYRGRDGTVQGYLVGQGWVATGPRGTSDELERAEAVAKENKKGLWANWSEAGAGASASGANSGTSADAAGASAASTSFLDIETTFIAPDGTIYYHDLAAAAQAQFKAFREEFDAFHRQNPSATAASHDLPYNLTKPPKKGELVSVLLGENGKYYRGKVLGYDKVTGLYEVKHIDYGNVDQVTLSALRALPSFYGLHVTPSFAGACKLKHVTLPPAKAVSYLDEALEVLDELTVERTLVLAVPGGPSSGASAGPVAPALDPPGAILYDAKESLKDSSYTINKKLVEEGYGIVEASTTRDEFYHELVAAQDRAIEGHKGCWEYGRVSYEDED